MSNIVRSNQQHTGNEFRIDVFGTFQGEDIRSIVDAAGRWWFLAEVVADALQVDRSTVTRAREHHPEEFREGDEYDYFVVDGKRRLCFSEEGFLRILDASQSDRAVRLRRWMRQQFKIRQEGDDLVVRSKTAIQEDFSDLGKDLMIMQQMLNSIAEDRRRIRELQLSQAKITEEVEVLEERVSTTESRVSSLEGNLKIGPGEMSAIHLAQECGWFSSSGGAHNVAVILASFNAGFHQNDRMVRRYEQGPQGRAVEVWIFTPQGVTDFKTRIDSRYNTGQDFELVPNQLAEAMGHKNRRMVYKRRPATRSGPAALPAGGVRRRSLPKKSSATPAAANPPQNALPAASSGD